MKKWTKKEIEVMFGYIEADDSDTIEESFEFAAYMMHYESGLDFPLRTAKSVKSKFYNELNKRNKNISNENTTRNQE